MKYLLALLILASCASKKEVIQGYSGDELDKMLGKIQGRTPTEAIQIMGAPATYGLCKSCDKGVYKIIYLERDMTKFYYGLHLNTDAEINCVVLNFYPNFKMRKYFFDRKTGVSKQLNCNQKGGAIMELNRILDEQDVADAAAKEAEKEAAEDAAKAAAKKKKKK